MTEKQAVSFVPGEGVSFRTHEKRIARKYGNGPFYVREVRPVSSGHCTCGKGDEAPKWSHDSRCDRRDGRSRVKLLGHHQFLTLATGKGAIVLDPLTGQKEFSGAVLHKDCRC